MDRHNAQIRLAVIGSGPTCTYAMERLAANIECIEKSNKTLEIYIFDGSGDFGAGSVHSPRQTKSSFLNRIAGQVCFSADPSNGESVRLLNEIYRPTLSDWCLEKFRSTGNEEYNISPKDWPKRYIHGEALSDMFRKYIGLLQSTGRVEIELIAEDVVDIFRSNYLIEMLTANGGHFRVNECLFVSGHTWHKPEVFKLYEHMSPFERDSFLIKTITSPYPLEKTVQGAGFLGDRCIAVRGMGLTGIDVFMYLSEGLGGKFHRNNHHGYVYQASGAEPRKIIGFSRSGLFTYARPENAKEENITELEHRPAFLTKKNIQSMRKYRGVASSVEDVGEVFQLHFERDVLPIIRLEQIYVYYKTLLGFEFGEKIKFTVAPELERFITGNLEDFCTYETKSTYFETIVNGLASRCLCKIDEFFDAETPEILLEETLSKSAKSFIDFLSFEVEGAADHADPLHFRSFLKKFRSRFVHKTRAMDHLYTWEFFINPLYRFNRRKSLRDNLIEFMEYDHYQARQDNLRNPFKAACDAIWRDLRQEIAFTIDFGGLTADSHALFLKDYMRVHNRLGNGACLEVMEKMLALIKQDLLDVSFGANPELTLDTENSRILIRGGDQYDPVEIDLLIDAKLHDFNPDLDHSPLFSNMSQRGIIKKWTNSSSNGSSFQPGGLSLTRAFHPIDINGHAADDMTFLGPASEGIFFFQIGAARPNQNHHVMVDVINWSVHFLAKYFPIFSRKEVLISSL